VAIPEASAAAVSAPASLRPKSTRAAQPENPQGSYRILVNGQSFAGVSHLLDGTDNHDAVLGWIVINPTLESTVESKITTQNYDAEFGLAIAGGYFLAGRVLAPVDAMAETARRITAASLSARLPVENTRDEFGRLATVFNETLARLEAAFEQLRRFTADASHELRSPLTGMRSVGEVALQRSLTAQGYREVIGSMLEEVDRLTRLVENLLLLTRADAGRIPLTRTLVDLRELVAGVVDSLRVLADEKDQRLTIDVAPRVMAECDAGVLRQGVGPRREVALASLFRRVAHPTT